MKNTRFLLSAAAAVTAAILLSGCSTPEETMSESSQPQAPSYRYEHELNVIDDNTAITTKCSFIRSATATVTA